jgi:hypothetical protein
MKRVLSLAAAIFLALAAPVAAQSSASAPGTLGNGQVGTGAATLPTLATSSSAAVTTTTTTATQTTSGSSGGGSGGAGSVSAATATSGRVGGATGSGTGVQVLCLAAGASVTEPFFIGTDLSCAP